MPAFAGRSGVVGHAVADDILWSFPARAAVHDPAAFLRRFRHPHPRQGRPGFAKEDGTVYSRQSTDGNQELGIKNPDGVVRMHHQSRYKAVDMRMPRQRPSPGVKGDHHADFAPEPVLCQDRQRLRRGVNAALILKKARKHGKDKYARTEWGNRCRKQSCAEWGINSTLGWSQANLPMANPSTFTLGYVHTPMPEPATGFLLVLLGLGVSCRRRVI